MDSFFEEPSDDEPEMNQRELDSVIGIAITKSYIYMKEYNPTSGRVEDKHGAIYLKEGYIEGFLAGFNYKFTGDPDI